HAPGTRCALAMKANKFAARGGKPPPGRPTPTPLTPALVAFVPIANAALLGEGGESSQMVGARPSQPCVGGEGEDWERSLPGDRGRLWANRWQAGVETVHKNNGQLRRSLVSFPPALCLTLLSGRSTTVQVL